MGDAGFVNPRHMGVTGFRTSRWTVGALFAADKADA
jgi:hypothetical protein